MVSKKIIDHINGNKLDNRKANLRICTYSENTINVKRNLQNKFRGVSFDKLREKWKARISVNGKRIQLGRFDTKIQAAIRYNSFAIKFHGSFANLNEV